MYQIILSQANRVANGDPDTRQNILAFNSQNYQNAFNRGKQLSIGEQVNFMKHRAGELKSGIRKDFGNGRHSTAKDVYNKRLYYSGSVEIMHFHHEDNSDNTEKPESGKGEITSFTSDKDVEAACIFNLDLESFLRRFSRQEQNIFTKRLEGFTLREISTMENCSTVKVRQSLNRIGKSYVQWFAIKRAERFGLV